MSLARRHRERMLAERGAIQVASGEVRSGPAATEYELMRARLGVDLRRLKEIQSIEKKIELKRELLPAYFDWVKGVLTADTGAQDDILVQIMIWLIDVGEFCDALDLAQYVIRHRLPLPERFDRTAGTLIAEEIAEAALKAFGQGADFDLFVLDAVDNLTDAEDMPDQVRAKLFKARAIHADRTATALDPAADGPAGQRQAGFAHALDLYRRAYGLDKSVGVKKDMDRIERELKKLAPPVT